MAERAGACYIVAAMTPFDPKYPELRRRRFRPIPVRMLVPNVITLLAICAGLTAIRLSIEGRMELAVAAIVFAAILDGVDGRVARMIKGQSKFGAELDSLADFVNFGVAPGLMLYFWQLHELNNGGWIAAMVFAIAGGLRLARFNASIDDPNKPAFAANYFTGVPAPAGAILAMLPFYLAFLGVSKPPAMLTAFYTLLIAFLMVSRLPVFSGKTVRMRVPPEMVLPVFVSVVFFVALLIGYPWHILSFGSVLYLLSLPWGWKSYRDHERNAARRAAGTCGGRRRAVDIGADVRIRSGFTGSGFARSERHRGRTADAPELSDPRHFQNTCTQAAIELGSSPISAIRLSMHGFQRQPAQEKTRRKRREQSRYRPAACFRPRSAGAL